MREYRCYKCEGIFPAGKLISIISKGEYDSHICAMCLECTPSKELVDTAQQVIDSEGHRAIRRVEVVAMASFILRCNGDI